MNNGAARADLLGRDYWLVLSSGAPSTTADDIRAHLDAHLRWLLELERRGVLFLSGPLLDGPDARPGSGVSVFRVDTAEEATALAAQDPFVRHGLRSTAVYRWRVNEGSIGVTVSLGTGTYRWE